MVKRQNNSSIQKAVVDIGRALSGVFKKYRRQTSERAAKKLCTPDGRKAVDQLAQNPNRPLNQFSKLAFRDWIENVEPSLVGNTVPPPTDSHMIPVTLSYAVYNIFQQYWEGQNDPLYAILSRRGHSVDWVHVFASQEEIDRLGEVAMEIIDDPESEKPAIATAESLLPKLKEAGWKDHD